MRQRLPVTFRVNKRIPNYENFLATLNNSKLLPKILSTSSSAVPQDKGLESNNRSEGEGAILQAGGLNASQTREDSEDIPEDIHLSKIKWHPNELVWQLNTYRKALKKSKALKELHQFIQKASDSGLISRQELVSMLPPLLLNAQPNELILDMCAAPGNLVPRIF